MAKTAIKLRDLESKVGQEVGISPWVEMTQERIDTFARATEDFQWIHVDPKRAKDSPFGGTIAHGFLTLSMLPKLSESTFEFSDRKMGVNYGLNKVRFTSPVPAGAKIRGRFVLARYEKIEGNGVQTTWSVTMEREGGEKPVCVLEAISRHYF
jgi:acyl dehydratase